MKRKKCTKCGEIKPASEFNNSKRNKDGLTSWCKECKNKDGKKYRDANPEKVRARHKKYKKNNPEKIAAAQQRRRRENPKKVRARDKEYRDANPGKVKAATKKWRTKNPKKMWVIYTLGQHRKRGYETQITTDELVEIAKQAKSCPICGCELAWGPKGKGGKTQSNSPSLDRINNDQIINKNTIQNNLS